MATYIMYGANRLRPTLSPVRHEQRLFGITVSRDLIWKRCSFGAFTFYSWNEFMWKGHLSFSSPPIGGASERARKREREKEEPPRRGTNADETINLPLTSSSDVKRMAALPSFDINARHKFINLLTDSPALASRDNRLLFRFDAKCRAKNASVNRNVAIPLKLALHTIFHY